MSPQCPLAFFFWDSDYLLNKEKGFIIYLDFSMCIVGADVSVPSHWIQQGAMRPVGCDDPLCKWQQSHLTVVTWSDGGFFFLKNVCWTSWFSISWLSGPRGRHKHWFLRRNDGTNTIWNIIGISPFSTLQTPSSSKIPVLESFRGKWNVFWPP